MLRKPKKTTFTPGEAARMGVSGIEVNTGGWSTAPHFDLVGMKASADKRRAFLTAFEDHGLEVISLNANGNPLHPTDPAQSGCLKDTIRVAGEMGITKVCTMSGLPAGGPEDRMPNWVISSWPDHPELPMERGDDPLLGRDRLACHGAWCGAHCLELHGNQCVYYVPSPHITERPSARN